MRGVLRTPTVAGQRRPTSGPGPGGLRAAVCEAPTLYRNEAPSRGPLGLTQMSLGGRTIGVKDRDGTLARLSVGKAHVFDFKWGNDIHYLVTNIAEKTTVN